jgi:hypothetical protein
MIKKWLFVAGAGVGYILGTRAGREQYERMRSQAREFLDQPKVKEATGTVQAEATRLYDEGRAKVKEKVRQLNDRTSTSDPNPAYPVTTPVTPSTTSFAGGSHDDLPPSAN